MSPEPPTGGIVPASGQRGLPWAWAFVFAAALAVYAPALRCGFVWDDEGHVTRADLRPLRGLWRIWFEPGATQQYYPVVHTAFWLEYRAWGPWAAPYHLLNVALHATAACLFAHVLLRLRFSSAVAWAAALLFAIHPVAVESVAWVSEQKNTLSTVLLLASALVYLRFAERRGRGTYVAALALFVLALGSKTTTSVLPPALLVVLWWRAGKLDFRRDLMPLVPWLALAAAAGVVTEWVERRYIGAHGVRFDLTFLDRCLLAGRATWFYVGKLLWPARLVFIYPRWRIDAADWRQYIPAVALVTLAVAAFAARRRFRGPLAVLLLYVGLLFPALGFFNVYPFVFSFVADHFQYLASLAVFAAAAAAGALVWEGIPKGGRAAGLAVLAAAGVTLGTLTWRQCGDYRDLETFFRAILRRNPAAWLAHDNLGVILALSGRMPEAMEHYEAALRLNPDYPQTHNNLGNALAREGRWVQAAAAYREALRLDPGFADAELNWGNALADAGIYGEAEAHFRRALELRPVYPEAHYGLANALGNDGALPEAIVHYAEALRQRPAYVEALANLGLALARVGRLDEAVERLETALSLRPGYAEACAYLGFARAGQGRLADAASAYRDALRLDPDNADVHYQLALVLRAMGDEAGAQIEFAAARRIGAGNGLGGTPKS